MLTSKQVDGLLAKPLQYKVADGEGLYLVVTKRGVKSWRYNYKIDGKYKTQTYGQYPTIGLAKARLLNSNFKDRVTQGIVNEYPVFLFASLNTRRSEFESRLMLAGGVVPIADAQPVDRYIKANCFSIPWNNYIIRLQSILSLIAF